MGALNVDIIQPNAGTMLDLKNSSKASLRVKDLNNADYTISDSDGFDFVTSVSTLTANRTLTLPGAPSNIGRIITIKKSDLGLFAIIIDTPGSETIDGAAQNRISLQYGWVTILCVSSTAWTVLNCNDYVQAVAVSGGTTPAVVTGTDTVIANVSISEGEWEISGQGSLGNVWAAVTGFTIGISTSTTLPPSNPSLGDYKQNAFGQSNTLGLSIGNISPYRVKITAVATYYLVGQATLTNTNAVWLGRISARRVG